jgi:hypothetical protein
MLYTSAVQPGTLELLTELQKQPLLRSFYLVGGTALALHFGHRISIDIDLFTNDDFDTRNLLDVLGEKYSIEILSQSKNALTIDIKNIKADFVRHNYPLIKSVIETNGIKWHP